MIKRKMRLIITFRTTTEAMAMEQLCRSCGADGRLIPVPAFISAGCGLAWSALPESRSALEAMMRKHGIAHEAMHQCLV